MQKYVKEGWAANVVREKNMLLLVMDVCSAWGVFLIYKCLWHLLYVITITNSAYVFFLHLFVCQKQHKFVYKSHPRRVNRDRLQMNHASYLKLIIPDEYYSIVFLTHSLITFRHTEKIEKWFFFSFFYSSPFPCHIQSMLIIKQRKDSSWLWELVFSLRNISLHPLNSFQDISDLSCSLESAVCSHTARW